MSTNPTIEMGPDSKRIVTVTSNGRTLYIHENGEARPQTMYDGEFTGLFDSYEDAERARQKYLGLQHALRSQQQNA